MAVTKILARKGRLDIGIDYILNGDKTEQKILTAHQGCEPGRECRQMLETKRDTENMGGVQYYHNQLAELNRQIRAERKKLALCREIQTASKQMEEDIRKTETRGKEVEHDEHRRR